MLCCYIVINVCTMADLMGDVVAIAAVEMLKVFF